MTHASQLLDGDCLSCLSVGKGRVVSAESMGLVFG